jgi:serine/threonine-protein kinase
LFPQLRIRCKYGLIAFTLLVGKAYWLEDLRRGYDPMLFALIAANAPQELASVRAARYGVTLHPGFDAWFANATALALTDRFATAVAATTALAELFGISPPSSARSPQSLRYPAAAPSPCSLESITRVERRQEAPTSTDLRDRGRGQVEVIDRGEGADAAKGDACRVRGARRSRPVR